MTKWTVEVRGALLQTYVIVILYVPSKLSCSAVCSMNVDYVRMLVGLLGCLHALG
jgi:hypothetical protein